MPRDSWTRFLTLKKAAAEEWEESNSVGIVRSVRLDFVPEAEVGDYVMVHVGFAISRVDGEEAKRTYRILKEMGALSEELPPEDWSV